MSDIRTDTVRCEKNLKKCWTPTNHSMYDIGYTYTPNNITPDGHQNYFGHRRLTPDGLGYQQGCGI